MHRVVIRDGEAISGMLGLMGAAATVRSWEELRQRRLELRPALRGLRTRLVETGKLAGERLGDIGGSADEQIGPALPQGLDLAFAQDITQHPRQHRQQRKDGDGGTDQRSIA